MTTETAAAPAHPTADRLRMDADQLNAFLKRAFPGAGDLAREVRPGFIEVVRTSGPHDLRPGGVVSGPTLMSLADTAAYLLVLAHIGEQPMAVTASLTMNFLLGCAPGEIHAEARLLRLGRRLATSDVRLWSVPGRLAAQASVVYALPD